MRGARGIHRHTEEGPARVSGTFTDVRPEEHTVVGSQQQQQQTSRGERSGVDLTVEFGPSGTSRTGSLMAFSCSMCALSRSLR